MAKKSNIGSHWMDPVGVLAILFIGAMIFLFVSKPYLEGFTNSDTQSSNKAIFYYFCMKTCGHCNDFNSTWEELNDKMKENNKVQLMKVYVNEQEELSKKYNVKGVPTLILQVPNKKSIEYTGDRTVSGISSFIQENL